MPFTIVLDERAQSLKTYNRIATFVERFSVLILIKMLFVRCELTTNGRISYRVIERKTILSVTIGFKGDFDVDRGREKFAVVTVCRTC